jgi:hypothetical protein
MNKEQFLDASLTQISQVYSGKRYCCRCGCGGTYTTTSYMVNPFADDTNDKLVERRLRKAKKLVLDGAEVDYGTTYVDVQTGENRTLTFYFDEVK